jgi:hypothetical protein
MFQLSAPPHPGDEFKGSSTREGSTLREGSPFFDGSSSFELLAGFPTFHRESQRVCRKKLSKFLPTNSLERICRKKLSKVLPTNSLDPNREAGNSRILIAFAYCRRDLSGWIPPVRGGQAQSVLRTVKSAVNKFAIVPPFVNPQG